MPRRTASPSLNSYQYLMRGTPVQAKVKCGRRRQVCESGEKHLKVHLSVNLNRRTRCCYVGQARKEAVSLLLREYQRAWKIIGDNTEVNLELLRGEHAGRQIRRRACEAVGHFLSW